MKVLIILGHPRVESLSGALADAFADGARRAAAEVRQINLATMDFDPHLRTASPNEQALETGLWSARRFSARCGSPAPSNASAGSSAPAIGDSGCSAAGSRRGSAFA